MIVIQWFGIVAKTCNGITNESRRVIVTSTLSAVFFYALPSCRHTKFMFLTAPVAGFETTDCLFNKLSSDHCSYRKPRDPVRTIRKRAVDYKSY
jgi:hypothetical protein